MNKNIVLFSLYCFFILFTHSVRAQSLFLPDDGVQVSLYTGNAQYKDYLFNGMRNNGITLSLDIGYSLKTNILNHEIKAGIGGAKLWNRFGWDSNALQYGIQYRLLALVSDEFQLGGTVGYASLFYKNENIDSHHSHWRTNFNLGLSACYQVPVNYKWSFFLPFNLPLIGAISRPAPDRSLILNEPDLQVIDVLKRANSHFQFVALGYKYFRIETGFFFQVKVNQSNRLALGYQVQYEQTNISLKSKWLTHQVGVQYSFKKAK